MNPQKQFTGFMSSVSKPGQLSLTVSSLRNTVISAVALLAVVKGLDSQAITNQVQQVFDLVATGLTAGLTIYHTLKTLEGLTTKLMHAFFAKPVVTVPAAVPSAVVTEPVA
jgi:hypothetical protein